jgi:hypothetical protein
VNPDSSIDSICSECFALVATGMVETDLEAVERVHACDSRILERLKKLQEPSAGPIDQENPSGRFNEP